MKVESILPSPSCFLCLFSNLKNVISILFFIKTSCFKPSISSPRVIPIGDIYLLNLKGFFHLDIKSGSAHKYHPRWQHLLYYPFKITYTPCSQLFLDIICSIFKKNLLLLHKSWLKNNFIFCESMIEPLFHWLANNNYPFYYWTFVVTLKYVELMFYQVWCWVGHWIFKFSLYWTIILSILYSNFSFL